MPDLGRPVIHRSNGYATLEFHDNLELGSSVSVRYPDPLAASDKSVSDKRLSASAAEYLEAALERLREK